MKALLEEIHAGFEIGSVDSIEALYMLDTVDIPTQNVPKYGNEKM